MPNGSTMDFNFFGIRIHISFFFTFLICLISAFDESRIFLYIFLSVFLHETAHIVTMLLLKEKVKRINFIPGCIQIVKENTSSFKEETAVSLSGPLFNLLLFAVFYGVYHLTKREWALIFSASNLLYGTVNLFPVSGLDGGKAVSLLLENRFGAEKSQRAVKSITLFTGTAFLFFGAYFFFYGKLNISFAVFGVYLILSALFN